MLGEDTTTDRGFQVVEFRDAYAYKCSLQQSSAIDNSNSGLNSPGSSFVWLGVDNSSRMHLSRTHVEGLIERLQNWLDTGSFVAELPNQELLDAVIDTWTKKQERDEL